MKHANYVTGEAKNQVEKDSTVPKKEGEPTKTEEDMPAEVELQFLNRKENEPRNIMGLELMEDDDDESENGDQPTTENQTNGSTGRPNDLGLILNDPEHLRDGTFEEQALNELHKLEEMRRKAKKSGDLESQDDSEIKEAAETLKKDIKIPVIPAVSEKISLSTSKISEVDIDESQPVKELDEGVNDNEEELLLERLGQDSPSMLNRKEGEMPRNKKLLAEFEDSDDEEELSPNSRTGASRRSVNLNVPQTSPRNRISDEERKNIVNVLRGSLTPAQLTKFENSDIIDVIKSSEGEEDGEVQIEYVYVQIVNRNSPCYKKIHEQ